MDIWNVWTALATGLIVGCSVGMLVTALLTMSSSDQTPEPDVEETREQKNAESRHARARARCVAPGEIR